MTSEQSPSPITERYNDRTYLEINSQWHSEDSLWKAAQIQRILHKANVQPTTIADVGCGAGEILVNLAKAWPAARLDGYELSQDAYAICKPKESGNLRFHLADLAEAGQTYDLALCIDVFEHVENYLEFLRRLRGVATWKVFHIPLEMHVNALFLGGFLRARSMVGHLHYFSSETALATLRDAGYEIVAHEFTAAFASDGQMARGGAAALMRLPRRLLFSLSPDFLSKTLGGCSLLVLAS
ncbi:MAG: class I SAM-dependent methyltransferase [Pseudomonadota bacterium]